MRQAVTGNMDKKRPWLVNAVLFSFSLAVAFGICEVILRTFFADRLSVLQEERSLLYRYDAKLGWFPRENSVHSFTGSNTISTGHNSRGFRDREHQKSDRPGLLFLGDSFVWGYDVEAADRFTEKLQLSLPQWEIYNLGVSGYSTDQEFLLLMDQFDFYSPRIVFLVFCTYNDSVDNSSNNIGRGAYYKPYFDISGGDITLKGTPVPASLTYFGRRHPTLIKSYLVRLIVESLAPPLVTVADPTVAIVHRMNEFIARKGSRLVVGLTEPHRELEYFMRENKIPYIQLSGAETFPTNGFHWTPSGHASIAGIIHGFLTTNGLMNIEGGKEH